MNRLSHKAHKVFMVMITMIMMMMIKMIKYHLTTNLYRLPHAHHILMYA